MNRKLLMMLMGLALLAGCKKESAEKPAPTPQPAAADTVGMRLVTVGTKTYHVANQDDSMHVYRQQAQAEKCFFVISKKDFRLYVYEQAGADTLLAAHFPVCYARYPEAKTQSGDMRTPECGMDKPFSISQIQEATDWCHDFGDGRGSIRSYGDWFLRLETPGFKGVGIHGSTNNEASVPGRDSEGCIRLRDADLRILHDRFARVGTKVVVTGARQPEYSFQQKARLALADKYVSPRPGYKMPQASEATGKSSDQGNTGVKIGEKPSDKEIKEMTRKPQSETHHTSTLKNK